MTPTNNQIIAPYLFAKKLVPDWIGKKQEKMILKTIAKLSHNFFVTYVLNEEIAKKITIK